MIQTEVDSDVTKSKSIYYPVYLNIFKSNLEHYSTNHEPYIIDINYLKVRVNSQLSSD